MRVPGSRHTITGLGDRLLDINPEGRAEYFIHRAFRFVHSSQKCVHFRVVTGVEIQHVYERPGGGVQARGVTGILVMDAGFAHLAELFSLPSVAAKADSADAPE